MNQTAPSMGRPARARLNKVDLSDPCVQKFLRFLDVARPHVRCRVIRLMSENLREARRTQEGETKCRKRGVQY